MSMDVETVKELLATGARLTAIDHPGGGQAVLVPQGYKFEHLKDPARKPWLVWGEEQQTKGKSELEVPETLGLRMPIFDRGDAWAMNAWLRTRIKDGKLYFLVKLDRPDVIVKAALGKLQADIRQRTELLVAPGRP